MGEAKNIYFTCLKSAVLTRKCDENEGKKLRDQTFLIICELSNRFRLFRTVITPDFNHLNRIFEEVHERTQASK